jgi:lambda repressor-like predicted transcriptional regulator
MAINVQNGWTKEEIKEELRKYGYTLKAVGEMVDLSSPTVARVLVGRQALGSNRVQDKIAELLKTPVSHIWPERYAVETKRVG